MNAARQLTLRSKFYQNSNPKQKDKTHNDNTKFIKTSKTSTILLFLNDKKKKSNDIVLQTVTTKNCVLIIG